MGSAETSRRHHPESPNCFHCGEPVPVDCGLTVKYQGQQRPVCCAGCRAVFQLITDAGLDRYYQFRQALGRKASEDLERQRLAWQAIDSRENLWGAVTADGQRDLLLQVEGLRCAACAWLIRSQLESAPGIQAVQVDVASGFTRITWDPRATRLSAIAMALFELGYVPHLPIASAQEQGRRTERRESMKRLGVAGLGMMQVMMYAVGLYAGDAAGMSAASHGFLTWVSLLVTLPVLLYSGRVFFVGAWRGLRAGRPGMDLPVALAIGIAFGASCINFFRSSGEVWFDSVVMFIFFLTVGRHLELVLRHRNVQAATALARLMPEWAQRLTEQGSEIVPSGDLRSGDRVRVAPGESFPADGIIRSGQTQVDEALLTGESRPVAHGENESVIAGTVNLAQAVEVEVTAAGSESTVSALGRLVLAAQSRKAGDSGMPAWLVPAFVTGVLVLASGTWLFWHLVDPQAALPATLAVLVASCPCALSLALPAVHSAASHRLLQEGVLLTRSAAVHELLRVDTVVFDKTGTLTTGRPEVRQICLNPLRTDCSEETAMRVATALEAHSIHPVARAFRGDTAAPTAREVISFPSGGLEGLLEGRRWVMGTARFVGERCPMAAPEDPGNGDIWLADEAGVYARFTLGDAVRAAGRETVAELSGGGLNVLMLSGDGEQAVARVARAVGIDDWQSGMAAEAKLQAIEALHEKGKTVLMVGDGANDAPVLAAADVSMTVQGATELANSTADFILTTASLRPVQGTFAICRRTAVLVKQNLLWALAYNVSVLPLAMSGMLKPWMAALGMSASSLLVVLNAARLARPFGRRDAAETAELQAQAQ